MPPPGPYVPPNQNQNTPPPQGYGAQHQQQGHQQPRGPMTYQSPAQGHGQPSQSHKTSGGTFGQMMNQAVTTSKPMLNKLSKTISSRLGNKPTTPETPQHLQSYQNYQQHYGQQTQAQGQPQSQIYSPQVQQTHQQPQAPNTYAPQQSPYQQSNYGQGQGNYFTQQAPATPQAPYTQPTPPLPQPSHVSYVGTQFGQGSSTVGEQQVHVQQGQYHQGQMNQGQTQTQGQYQQQPLQAQYTGQQMGVVGGSQHSQPSSNPQSTQVANASPHSPAPQQTQWHNSHTGSEQSFVSAYQQQPTASTAHAHTQSYFPNTSVQAQSNNQQWAPLSLTSSEGQNQNQLPPASISPPPPPPVQSKLPGMPSAPSQQSQSSTPAPQPAAARPGPPTEFIAELPADMGSLSIAEAKPVEHASAPPSGQTSPYQAYQLSTAQAGSSSSGFTIARRAVSINDVPYADPWRFADPLTKLPTREFYVIADLLFDALDRKFEPQNTGILEASKILRSWIDSTEDTLRKFLQIRCHAWLILIFTQNFSRITLTARLARCGAFKAFHM